MLKKQMKADRLDVKIYDSRKAMGEASGKEAGAYIRDLLSKKDEIYIIFAAAPSQNEFLETVSNEPGIDWGRIHAIHMDEYVNLDPKHPAGFGNFLRRAIFDHHKFASIDYIGTDPDYEATLKRYDAILAAHKPDICFMGIGENGHIAFNDPHVADFHDPLRIKRVDLDPVCRQQQVNDGCLASLDEVPLYALTLTIPTLMSSDRIFCVVPAPSKTNAATTAVLGPVEEKCPASLLKTHPGATLYLDSDSGKNLL